MVVAVVVAIVCRSGGEKSAWSAGGTESFSLDGGRRWDEEAIDCQACCVVIVCHSASEWRWGLRTLDAEIGQEEELATLKTHPLKILHPPSIPLFTPDDFKNLHDATPHPELLRRHVKKNNTF